MSLGARIVVAVAACLFGVIMFLHGTTADPDKAWFSYLFGAFCVAIAAACVLRGRAARFFGSVVGSCAFLAGVFYLGHEILAGPVSSGSRSQPSIFNAVLFMIVFGVPGALYAFKARFGFGKSEPGQGDRADGPSA
jgi:hypothetical protein